MTIWRPATKNKCEQCYPGLWPNYSRDNLVERSGSVDSRCVVGQAIIFRLKRYHSFWSILLRSRRQGFSLRVQLAALFNAYVRARPWIRGRNLHVSMGAAILLPPPLPYVH